MADRYIMYRFIAGLPKRLVVFVSALSDKACGYRYIPREPVPTPEVPQISGTYTLSHQLVC
jgi:hypothetical protein